jgi:hypothetical protein
MNLGRADLALSVDRVGDVYRAATVLTLDMAYNNARLIARPDRVWLEPLVRPGALPPSPSELEHAAEAEPVFGDSRSTASRKLASAPTQTTGRCAAIWGKTAIERGSQRVRTRGNRDPRAYPTRLRKPPVGSSSLPVGSDSGRNSALWATASSARLPSCSNCAAIGTRANCPS